MSIDRRKGVVEMFISLRVIACLAANRVVISRYGSSIFGRVE